MRDTISFYIPDMTCAHCEKALRQAIGTTLPDADVHIDLASHMLRVSGDAQLAEAAIRDAGYTPQPRP